jgi:hypothetical protein
MAGTSVGNVSILMVYPFQRAAFLQEPIMTTNNRFQAVLRTLMLSVFSGALLVSMATDAFAQLDNKKGLQAPQITKGTVDDIIRKGRATSLVIKSEAGGNPITVPITPRLQFAVQAKGDDGFLTEKQVVSGTGTLTNKLLFVKVWTVHVGLAARKVKPFVKKSGKTVGQSQNSYDFAGTISSRQQDKDYPDYQTLATNIRQLKGQPIYIDKGATVTVSMTETDLVEKGAKVEFIQQVLKNGRIQIVGLRVLLDKPLKAEEFLNKDKPKTSRRKTSS